MISIVEEFSASTPDNDGIQRSVSDVMEALDQGNIVEMTEEFDKSFAVWQTYMKMVEILLNFIRAN